MKKILLILILVGSQILSFSQQSSDMVDNAYNEDAILLQEQFEYVPSNNGMMSFDFCDDFNVPNTTTINNWTEVSGDWEILDQKLHSPTGSGKQITVNGSDAVDGILTCTAIYEGGPNVRYVGLIARKSGGGYILFKIQDNYSVGYWDSYYIYAPGTSVQVSGGNNFGTDPIIQLEYSGQDITVRIDTDKDGNWEVENTTTTTLTSTGLCGVEAYNTVSADDFCSGPVTPMDPSVPLSGWGIIISLIAISSLLLVRKIR